MSEQLIVKYRRKWAVVTDYGHSGGSGHRNGYWCNDLDGGWGVSSRSPEAAVRECHRPMLFQTKREAREYADEEAATWNLLEGIEERSNHDQA